MLINKPNTLPIKQKFKKSRAWLKQAIKNSEASSVFWLLRKFFLFEARIPHCWFFFPFARAILVMCPGKSPSFQQDSLLEPYVLEQWIRPSAFFPGWPTELEKNLPFKRTVIISASQSNPIGHTEAGRASVTLMASEPWVHSDSSLVHLDCLFFFFFSFSFTQLLDSD